jgi:hypothetical protein
MAGVLLEKKPEIDTKKFPQDKGPHVSSSVGPQETKEPMSINDRFQHIHSNMKRMAIAEVSLFQTIPHMIKSMTTWLDVIVKCGAVPNDTTMTAVFDLDDTVWYRTGSTTQLNPYIIPLLSWCMQKDSKVSITFVTARAENKESRADTEKLLQHFQITYKRLLMMPNQFYAEPLTQNICAFKTKAREIISNTEVVIFNIGNCFWDIVNDIDLPCIKKLSALGEDIGMIMGGSLNHSVLAVKLPRSTDSYL